MIAITSLFIQIPLAKYYGPIGCAIGIACSLILGQIIIMNIYYHKRQKINIIMFWKEIGKMSILPSILLILSNNLLKEFNLNSLFNLTLSIIIYSIVYLPLFWCFSMNQSERDLIKTPLKKLVNFQKK